MQSTAVPEGLLSLSVRGLRQIPARWGKCANQGRGQDFGRFPPCPSGARALVAAGLVILSVMFLSVAVWNGFPLVFYDTGG